MEAREGSAIDEALNIIAAAAAADVNTGPAATSAAAASAAAASAAAGAHGLEGEGRSEGRDLASISPQPRSDLAEAQIARGDAMAAGPGDGMAAGPGDLTLDAACSVDAGARWMRLREYL